MSSQAVAVTARGPQPFPVPVYKPLTKHKAMLVGQSLNWKEVSRVKKDARPLSGAQTERSARQKEEEKPARRLHVARHRIAYKPNAEKSGEDGKPQAVSPSLLASHSSMRVLIAETLRRQKKEKEKRVTELVESQEKSASRRAELQRRNERIRRDNLKHFKSQCFQPRVAWGADERKVLGLSDEIVRRGAQEERERHRSQASKSLGLEAYYQIRSEVLSPTSLRNPSSIPSPMPLEGKQSHTPDPYVQTYMKFKKRRQAEEEFARALLFKEAETRRISQLRSLESRSKKQLDTYRARRKKPKRSHKGRSRKRERKTTEPEDDEVKKIMERIDEEPLREEPEEGRECPLFGIIDDPSSSPPASTTRLCDAVLDHQSSPSQLALAPVSLSLPAISSESLAELRPEEEKNEVERKKEDMRRRLLELKLRVEKVKEPGESYRASIREETSEDRMESSSAGSPCVIPAPSSLPPAQPPLLLTVHLDVAEQLLKAKDEELSQLRCLEAKLCAEGHEAEWKQLLQNVEDRYLLFSKLLTEKKLDTESSLLGGLSPLQPSIRPVVGFPPTNEEEEEKSSIHSPELSEIHAEERLNRDKTAEISAELKLSFIDRPVTLLREDGVSPDPCDRVQPQFAAGTETLWMENDCACPMQTDALEAAAEAAFSLLIAEAVALSGVHLCNPPQSSEASVLLSEVDSKSVPPSVPFSVLAQEAFSEAFPQFSALQRSLATPLSRSPIATLQVLQESEVGQMTFEDLSAPPVLPARILTHLEAKFETEQSVVRLCYEGLNESLNAQRLFGREGEPMPWSLSARLGYPVRSFSEVQRRTEAQVRDWAETCIGVLPRSEFDEEALAVRREETLALALKREISERDRDWSNYEAEEAQVKLDVADMLMDEMIREIATLLGRL